MVLFRITYDISDGFSCSLNWVVILSWVWYDGLVLLWGLNFGGAGSRMEFRN